MKCARHSAQPAKCLVSSVSEAIIQMSNHDGASSASGRELATLEASGPSPGQLIRKFFLILSWI